MGNGLSQQDVDILQPPSSLVLKSGPKIDGVPCPATSGRTSYDKLVLSTDFKAYVCKNLDNDFLMISLLQNALSEPALLDLIEHFDMQAPEQKAEARERIEIWKSVASCGLQVPRVDSHNWVAFTGRVCMYLCLFI
jgi:hypothetical protein